MLLETQNSISQIDVLPSGIYILSLENENGSIGTRNYKKISL